LTQGHRRVGQVREDLLGGYLVVEVGDLELPTTLATRERVGMKHLRDEERPTRGTAVHLGGLLFIPALCRGAALFGHLEVVKRLLEAGADIENKGSGGGLSPLVNAASDGHFDMAQILVDRGARVTDDRLLTLGQARPPRLLRARPVRAPLRGGKDVNDAVRQFAAQVVAASEGAS
jgi:hypothetical protein